jgi:hypothetical protein
MTSYEGNLMTLISVFLKLQLSIFSSIDFYLIDLTIIDSRHTSEPKCGKGRKIIRYLKF